MEEKMSETQRDLNFVDGYVVLSHTTQEVTPINTLNICKGERVITIAKRDLLCQLSEEEQKRINSENFRVAFRVKYKSTVGEENAFYMCFLDNRLVICKNIAM